MGMECMSTCAQLEVCEYVVEPLTNVIFGSHQLTVVAKVSGREVTQKPKAYHKLS